MKPRTILSVLLAGMLVAAACSSDDATDGELETLSVSVLPVISFAPYYIAEANGYFADENLDIEFVESQRGVDTIPLLIQGDLDVWNGSINAALLNAAAAGEPVRVVADKGSLPAGACGYTGYMSSADVLDADGNIDASMIAGGRIASGGGMTTGFALANFLAALGLDESDVSIDTMGMSDRSAALQAGQVEVSSIAEPSITRLEEEGLVLLADGAEHSPDLTLAVVGFGPRLLNDRPDIGERFMRAYLRGVADYQAGPTADNLTIVADATEVAPEILEEACWPAVSADGSINTDVLADAQRWAIDDGQLERVVEADEYYEPRFAEAAVASIRTG